MPAPSSDGRPSMSSEPSATSSRTLHSRGSGTYVDNGEGSSHRQSLASRHGTSATNDADIATVEERDFAHRRQRVRRSGGFLLDSSFPSGPRKGNVQHQAHVQDAKGKRSSRRSEVPTSDGHQDDPGLRMGKTRNDAPPRTPQPASIDPNQLVHMALNLSESRKRNISASPLLASQPRAVSSIQRDGSFSNHGAGGSLKQYLHEQRRSSRNMSPIGGKGSPSRHMSSSMQRSGSLAFPGSQAGHPSAATLARRDKARDYIELRIQYMRLLEFLPPLKLDANAPGNYFMSANNVPGSPQAQLTRVPSHAGKQHDLGRPYNPLQYIRNRRSRARERRVLEYTSHEFTNADEVRDWVDRVQQQSKSLVYRQDDRVLLPKLHDDHPSSVEPSETPRAHKGWIFSPEELLADAYWLEQGDNKTIIENRHGRIIFPQKEIPKTDFLQPRASKEYSEQRRRSWVESAGVTVDPPSGGESEKGSERGRKRRLLPAFRADSPRHGKHSRRGSRFRNNADSDSSDSDTDSGKRHPRIVVDEEQNTGPLALQLDNLLKQQSQGTQAKSPAIISPDTPNKWGRDHVEEPQNRVSRDSLDVPRIGNGFTSMDHPGVFKVPPRSRTNATLSGDEWEPRSSFEDLDNTAPNTPLHQKRFPHIGSHPSPPPSRDSSVTRKPKRSKLNPFHSHETSEDHGHSYQNDPDPAGPDKKWRSRQASEETQDSGNVGHAIMAAPNAMKSLLGHRKNESTSSLSNQDKIRRRDTQEPQSAVTRFFKGVKHEGSKVGGFVFRRDRPDEEDAEAASDALAAESGTDTSVKGSSANRPDLSRSGTATTIDSIVPTQGGRYHLDLPMFKPASEVPMDKDGNLLSSDHISRQNLERKNSRSPRFDRLAPPRMDLERISSVSSQGTLDANRSQSQERMNKVLAHPGGVGLGGLPPTSLRDTEGSNNLRRSSSRPTLDGKRHWSITDHDGDILHRKPNANMVTQADIARVRALFLCSGVKAKEINRRAYAKRSPPPDFLARAAAAANTELVAVSRKEEHVLAARILMRELESSTQSLKASTQHFRNQTIKELTDRINELRSRVDADLMPRIFESGDTAIRITSEISGQGPLQVKQITDDIDRMLRARRRRMRWLRGLGWMLVEWALVAFLWWVWLVVVLVGFVKRVFGFGWNVLRWLLWL